ncbi:hypothetical protein Nmel_015288 [Mimus melanotis]
MQELNTVGLYSELCTALLDQSLQWNWSEESTALRPVTTPK